ncbi:hypothetical protein P9857_07590 [Anoxybacillus geothermalis]|uniref:type III-A CRISPR-associated RAMP protein Csm4 n=1 Tax=Geobacillus stearothermophilus TaxID=1422 RepID=UPI002EC63B67|nr:hypothetical protein [Anoxybacillus geothermalis]
MKLWEFRLRLESPFISQWQSDIIFGHLAWTYRDVYGEEALLSWLKRFDEAPPFVLSNGFITDTFPKPLLPPPHKNIDSKHELVSQIALGKKLKNTRFIHLEDFIRFIQGEGITITKPVEQVFEKYIRTHNTIDRDTGRSLEENGLYEIENLYIPKDKLLSIFVRVQDEASLDEFEYLLNLVSLQGYGNKKTTGFGQFTVHKKLEREDLDQCKDEANAVVWLSHGVPDMHDPIDGWYKLETKYGKVGGQVTSYGNLFKRPLTRITPGSVFKTCNPKPYYGVIMKNIYPFNKNVVQYAYALSIPIKLPTYLMN